MVAQLEVEGGTGDRCERHVFDRRPAGGVDAGLPTKDHTGDVDAGVRRSGKFEGSPGAAFQDHRPAAAVVPSDDRESCGVGDDDVLHVGSGEHLDRRARGHHGVDGFLDRSEWCYGGGGLGDAQHGTAVEAEALEGEVRRPARVRIGSDDLVGLRPAV